MTTFKEIARTVVDAIYDSTGDEPVHPLTQDPASDATFTYLMGKLYIARHRVRLDLQEINLSSRLAWRNINPQQTLAILDELHAMTEGPKLSARNLRDFGISQTVLNRTESRIIKKKTNLAARNPYQL